MMGRYSQNIGKQNRIGTLFSYKAEDESTATAPKHFTGTLDGFFRFNQALSGSFTGSMTNGLKNKIGYAASTQLRYNTNKWVAWWNQSIVTS